VLRANNTTQRQELGHKLNYVHPEDNMVLPAFDYTHFYYCILVLHTQSYCRCSPKIYSLAKISCWTGTIQTV